MAVPFFFYVGSDCAGVGGGGWELVSVELVAAELVAVAAELVAVAAELVAAELVAVAAELVAAELVAAELVVVVEAWRVVDLRIEGE